MNLNIEPYTERYSTEWDEFVYSSWNGTFLHSRKFLSYHKDRFDDASLLLRNEKGKLIGVFPAARSLSQPDSVVSHPGITYGGVVCAGELTGNKMVTAFEEIATRYSDQGYKSLTYKMTPHIYHRIPTQDDLYALFRLNATRVRSDLAAVFDLNPTISNLQRKKGQEKAKRENLVVEYSRFTDFWVVLEARIAGKFGQSPTHSCDEIQELHRLFPQEIECLTLSVANEVIAGVVLFKSFRVCHTQYIASNEFGYKINALDLLIPICIENSRKSGFSYLSFGASTEDAGRKLNEGLHNFKIRFGSGSIAQDFYELKLND